MFFFNRFPKTEYAFNDTPNEKKTVTNILTAFYLRGVSSLKYVFHRYTIRDDDTIESLSYKLYKSPLHYWTLLIINNIIDPFTEWAKPNNIMEKFVAKKYENGVVLKKIDGTQTVLPASQGIDGIHHFYNVAIDRICDDVEDAYYRTRWLENPNGIGNNIRPVTNFEYEKDIDIDSRQILIVQPSHIVNFEEDFRRMMNGRQ